ncbi:HNH endonuclease [Sporosarcina koreensis]|uniref:HNH endonuclease n=1 Tax=Sporosarcina koreensis TaxID=334735 RepID=UPI00075E3C12|nr:HNH endonuclease [Sporosarcina koreensis]
MEKWIITCNPNYYDVIGAFDEFDILNWKQSVNVHVGDIVYIYVGKPCGAIKYETKVIAVDLPEAKPYDSDYVIDGSNFEEYGKYMELQLLRTFDDELLPYKILKNEGLKSVQGPSRMTNELEKFISNQIDQSIEMDNRRYFFVFQNKSYSEEFKGAYLWAPQHGDNGRKVSHWEQMKDVQKGDLIIHSYLKKIVAISIAEADVYEADRPTAKGVHDEWNNKGWRVNAKYYPITNPIVTSDHMDKLLKLQPESKAPFNKLGRGNTGYLFTANKNMAEYVIRESSEIQFTNSEKEQLLRLLNKSNVQSDENKLDQELLDDIDSMLKGAANQHITYTPEPKEKPKANVSKGKRSYPRDRKVAMNALIRANHKCEIDVEHPSFLRRSTNTSYAEPHHLIPMASQNEFEHSLDVEANIVSLCSNCHNQIHYGLGSDILIEVLYKERKDELGQAGITISLSDLLNLYQ